jgi:hypothetical protein
MQSNSIAKGKQIQVQKVQCGAAGLIFYLKHSLVFPFLILLTAPAEWEKSGKKKKKVTKVFFVLHKIKK